jgi:ferredoxin-fold anticodon binding domain-containing protein
VWNSVEKTKEEKIKVLEVDVIKEKEMKKWLRWYIIY